MASTIPLPIAGPNHPWLHRLIYNLAAGFIFAAVVLRTLLVYQGKPFLWQILVLLAVWLLAFVLGSVLVRHLVWLGVLLTGVIAVLPLIFLYLLHMDFYASLFILVGIQAMRRYPPWIAGVLLGLALVLVFLILKGSFGVPEALALALIYAAASLFVAAYIGSTRKAYALQDVQQALLADLVKKNCKLEVLAQQQQQLAAERERQRLARELHDSVTQTIFSMTLATQSALLLQKRDPQQVLDQLDRLDELARSAMSEMQVLISHLAPESAAGDNFICSLQQHLEERQRMEGLAVTLEVTGSQTLTLKEQADLFRITQESLNNVIKHARVSEASLRLHLSDPLFIEIEDHGAGFDPQQAGRGECLGLAGMQARAAEIGWLLTVESAPGQGTCIRVEKTRED